jgi:broad specificity phosphatase PhoE
MRDAVIYLIRHPESRANLDRLAHRYVSDKMINLSQHGYGQLLSCSKFITTNIDTKNLTSIFYSPFLRCKLLANNLREKIKIPNNDYHFDNRLKELSYGDIKGLTDEEWQNKFARNYNQHRQLVGLQERLDFTYPNGESLTDLMLRLTAFRKEILDHSLQRQVIIVSHDKALRMLIATLNNKHPNNYFTIPTIPNVGIVRIYKSSNEYEIDSLIYPYISCYR